MDEKKRDIVMQATAIYMRFGVKSVTMDEMARQLGVSKKTLYLHVKDKNDLVEQCLMMGHSEQERGICEILETNENAIEQMLKISRLIMSTLKQIHPSIFFDIAKYHPNAMKMMDEHKQEFICGSIEDNLKNGIKQGVYRENLNPKIISTMYVSMMDNVMHGEFTPETGFKPDELYSEFFRYHIRGIASKKGLEFLKELIKKDPSLSLGM